MRQGNFQRKVRPRWHVERSETSPTDDRWIGDIEILRSVQNDKSLHEQR
jgi:hypothetical protein